LAQLGLGARGRVYGEDANAVMPRLGPDAVLARVFLHFPDPWWKKRHEKRLVMGDPFLQQVLRLLRPHGELFIQTDVEDRADQYRRFVTDFGDRFEPAGDVAGNPDLRENPYEARSPREHRAIADGLPIWRMRWRKK
jgi:tRNA (guanine-N7-)-methyltransferase